MQSLKSKFYNGLFFRERDKRFKDIFNAVNDGIFIVEPSKGQIKETNHVAAQMLGYEQSEIEGMSISKIHPDEMDQLKIRLKEVMQGRPVITDEFSCVRKDSKKVPVEISFSSLMLDGNTYIMAMLRDISERKEAEKALQEALKGAAKRLDMPPSTLRVRVKKYGISKET